MFNSYNYWFFLLTERKLYDLITCLHFAWKQTIKVTQGYSLISSIHLIHLYYFYYIVRVIPAYHYLFKRVENFINLKKYIVNMNVLIEMSFKSITSAITDMRCDEMIRFIIPWCIYDNYYLIIMFNALGFEIDIFQLDIFFIPLPNSHNWDIRNKILI